MNIECAPFTAYLCISGNSRSHSFEKIPRWVCRLTSAQSEFRHWLIKWAIRLQISSYMGEQLHSQGRICQKSRESRIRNFRKIYQPQLKNCPLFVPSVENRRKRLKQKHIFYNRIPFIAGAAHTHIHYSSHVTSFFGTINHWHCRIADIVFVSFAIEHIVIGLIWSRDITN